MGYRLTTKRKLTRYFEIGFLGLCLLSSLFINTFTIKADSLSLPDDSTPLQSGIYEALKAAKEAGEIVPAAEYFSYENGTTLTILTYENGTKRSFTETFLIENVNINVNPFDTISLPIDTTDTEATEYLKKISRYFNGFYLSNSTFNLGISLGSPHYGYTAG